jgi:hypothetical protein
MSQLDLVAQVILGLAENHPDFRRLADPTES